MERLHAIAMSPAISVLLLALLVGRAAATATPPDDTTCSCHKFGPGWYVTCSCHPPLKPVCSDKTCSCVEDGKAPVDITMSMCMKDSPPGEEPGWMVHCMCEEPLKPVCEDAACSCVKDGTEAGIPTGTA